jgi:hypothetical protein
MRHRVPTQPLGFAPSPSSARMFSVAVFVALFTLFSACSDPGSGGSGIPSSVNAPAPGTGSPGNLSAPRVEIIESNAVTIGGVRYLDSQIDVVLADGSVGNFGSLKVGQSIVVTQVPGSSAAPRWKLEIQAL